MITRATNGVRTRTTAIALPVASMMTSSAARKLLPKPSSADRVMSTLPAWPSRPSPHTATSAKVRWMSMPMTRPTMASLILEPRERGATRHLRIRAHGATGRVAEAASY